MEIVNYGGFYNCTVQFSDGTIRKNLCYAEIKKGEVKNLFNPLIHKVAYIGEGKYNSKIHKKAYNTWKGILERSYNKKFQEKQPTYKGGTVAEEWHNFQNFARRFEENYDPKIMQKWHLDKDILVEWNKTYSPETCAFIPAEINCLFYKKTSNYGILPIGVVKYKDKFVAQMTKHNKHIFLGIFNTIEEAFQAYKISKEECIKEAANKWKGKITDQVYQALINYNIKYICLSH